MLTLESCMKTLNKGSVHKYTNEETQKAREFLYLMANFQVEVNKNINTN